MNAVNDQDQWQVRGTAPELYDRYLVPAMTAMWARDLAQRAAVRRGDRVLDAACGTGVVARLVAPMVGSTGAVSAIDVNPGMLAVARALPPVPGPAIDWQEGSVLELPFPAGSFDLVMCQFGLQFFPAREIALHEFNRVLLPGGRLALNVFGPIRHNPATHALADALDRHVRPGASATKRAEHALADPEQLHLLVTDAGFADVAIETLVKTVRFSSAEDYVRIQLSATPLANLVTEHGQEERMHLLAALSGEVGAALATYQDSQGLAFPQEVHVLTGHATSSSAG
jgi:ubiquinone/menaquinone biosynthesis C-methylase UbiE